MGDISRRGFLGALSAFAATAVLDPEMLLWKPGAKTIFLPTRQPAAMSLHGVQVGDVFTIDGVWAINPSTAYPTGVLQQFVVTSADQVTLTSPGIGRAVGTYGIEPVARIVGSNECLNGTIPINMKRGFTSTAKAKPMDAHGAFKRGTMAAAWSGRPRVSRVGCRSIRAC